MTKFTPEKEQKFLAVLRQGGSVAKAAAAIRISRQACYKHRQTGEAFAQEWDAAIEEGTDTLEDEAVRRAVKGVRKPVYQKGELVGYVQEYSDTLLLALLNARRPEKFRRGLDVKHSGVVIQVTADDMAAARQAVTSWEREQFGDDAGSDFGGPQA